jgi:hypothetical protein
MAKPTKIVVVFDDGTTTDIPAKGVGSIFFNENKAKKCGHNPPYGKPPKKDDAGSTSTLMAMSTTGDGEEDAAGDSCYMVNGVIVCP